MLSLNYRVIQTYNIKNKHPLTIVPIKGFLHHFSFRKEDE